ncbi:hypothetical protein [Jannaschia sp. R86511]|uniref:hypothetical protein n=1 Tax=Jannaschia sp. R86511 TaxID=3093853 RepID=UPI0036D36920
MAAGDEPPQWRAWVAAAAYVTVIGLGLTQLAPDLTAPGPWPGPVPSPVGAPVDATLLAPPTARPTPVPAPSPTPSPSAAPTPTEPVPGEHLDYAGYELHPCGRAEVDPGSTWLSPVPITDLERDVDRMTGQAVVELGHLDLSDGRLGWQDGNTIAIGEDVEEVEPLPTLAVPASGAARVLGVSTQRTGPDGPWSRVEVVVVVLVEGVEPVRWEERFELGFGTDGGVGGVGGAAAVERLAAVRSWDESFSEIEESYRWTVNCWAYRTTAAPSAAAGPVDRPGPVWDALVLGTGGDGGFPGAVGLDATGRPVAALTSFGTRPFPCLGIPGSPPAEVALRGQARSCAQAVADHAGPDYSAAGVVGAG